MLMPHCCTNQSIIKPDQILLWGMKHNDVIFYYVIIEMVSSDNACVRITGVPINESTVK